MLRELGRWKRPPVPRSMARATPYSRCFRILRLLEVAGSPEGSRSAWECGRPSSEHSTRGAGAGEGGRSWTNGPNEVRTESPWAWGLRQLLSPLVRSRVPTSQVARSQLVRGSTPARRSSVQTNEALGSSASPPGSRAASRFAWRQLWLRLAGCSTQSITVASGLCSPSQAFWVIILPVQGPSSGSGKDRRHHQGKGQPVAMSCSSSPPPRGGPSPIPVAL